jgi:hypothetical protein
MKRAGCWQIAYGIESGSQRVLDVVKHEVRIPRMLDTLHQTRAAGIRVKGLMMMAHPTEDETSLRETVDFVRTAPIDLVQITKFTPYPGTPSYAHIREQGTFVEDWERMNAMNWVFVPRAHAGDPRALLPPRLPHVLRTARRALGPREDPRRRAAVPPPRGDVRARRATGCSAVPRRPRRVSAPRVAALIPAYQAAATVGGRGRHARSCRTSSWTTADRRDGRCRARGRRDRARQEPNLGRARRSCVASRT